MTYLLILAALQRVLFLIRTLGAWIPVLREVLIVPWTKVFLLPKLKRLSNTVVERTRVIGPVRPPLVVRGYELRIGLNNGARLFKESDGRKFTELAT